MTQEAIGPLCVAPATRPSTWRRDKDRWRAWIHAGTGPEDRGNCVATVYMGGAGGTLNTREAVDAMARLLAAAPALEAALTALLPLATRGLADLRAAQLDAAKRLPDAPYQASIARVVAAEAALDEAKAVLAGLAGRPPETA